MELTFQIFPTDDLAHTAFSEIINVSLLNALSFLPQCS
jgi:hypothetical protein